MTDTPAAVRILPMDSQEEFPDWSIERLQHEFFLEDLPFRTDGRTYGEYWFHKSGLAAKQGTVVLFQFRGSLIASAVLNNVERFEKPKIEVCDGVSYVYEGAFYFEPSSITVFDPVGADVVTTIWPEVTRLGRVKWSLALKGYTAFQRGLRHVEQVKA